MILQSLVQYYEALVEKGEITRPGWSTGKVSFALQLSPKGELCRVLYLKEEKEKGKKKVLLPRDMTVPQTVTRSSNPAANFLCDNSGYLLGIDGKGKPERSRDCFACAKEKHLEILRDCTGAMARSIVRFFETWQPEQAAEHPALSGELEEILAGGNLIFDLDGKYAQEDPEIREAWENYRKREEGKPDGICLVTGKEAQIARIHGLLKGVRGAQSSGAALISFNEPSFKSYGKEQSYNAPVGTYAAYAYTTALNKLLSDSRHVSLLGDTTVVYWALSAQSAYQDVFSAVYEPTVENQDIVDGVFQNLRKGKAVNVEGLEESLSQEEPFFILGLAPNAARIAVRFFYQDSFGNILKHLREHYDRMEVVKPAQDPRKYLGIWQILQETVNQKSREKKPAAAMAASTYRAILSGGRYPESLYQAVLGRLRAECDNKDSRIYKITRGRAAIIKAYLLQNGHVWKEELTVALNEENKNVAYLLGREFSVLEAIQQEANPGINATIKDRYFNSACAAPAAIFPVLFKLKNSHIRKIDSIGTKIYYEKLLGELQSKMEVGCEQELPYPRRLSLEEQGMFILGYYQQTQKRFEKKEKKKADEQERGNLTEDGFSKIIQQEAE